jgi:hypothetical protein
VESFRATADILSSVRKQLERQETETHAGFIRLGELSRVSAIIQEIDEDVRDLERLLPDLHGNYFRSTRKRRELFKFWRTGFKVFI